LGGCEGTGALVEEDDSRQHELARSSEQPRHPGEGAVGCRFMGSGSGPAVRARLRMTDRGWRLGLTPAGTRTSRAGAGKDVKTRWGAVTAPAR